MPGSGLTLIWVCVCGGGEGIINDKCCNPGILQHSVTLHWKPSCQIW